MAQAATMSHPAKVFREFEDITMLRPTGLLIKISLLLCLGLVWLTPLPRASVSLGLAAPPRVTHLRRSSGLPAAPPQGSRQTHSSASRSLPLALSALRPRTA